MIYFCRRSNLRRSFERSYPLRFQDKFALITYVHSLCSFRKLCAYLIYMFIILHAVFIPSIYAQDNEDAKVTKYTIKDYLEANLPPQEGRMIVLDEITGLLTITDTPKNHELARKLIKEWDIGPKQVQIEAKFIEITFTDLDEMGVDWQAITEEQHSILDFNTGMMGDASATTAATFKQAAEVAGLGFFAGKASVSGTQLLSYLKALQQSGKANLLHAPIVTTLSGQEANIQVVRSFPYATSATRDYPTSGGTTYVVETYKMAEEITGITLEVTPTVIGDSDVITLEIHPEVSELSSQGQVNITATVPANLGWPIIDTRTAQTTVMVRSGETIILGGLIQDKDDDTIERKIPLLGDAPLVGPLFRYKYEKRQKKNLVVFLTARLIDMQGKEIQ